MTFLCLYISRWWRQTWDTAPYSTVVNLSEARISTEHGISNDIHTCKRNAISRGMKSVQRLQQHNIFFSLPDKYQTSTHLHHHIDSTLCFIFRLWLDIQNQTLRLKLFCASYLAIQQTHILEHNVGMASQCNNWRNCPFLTRALRECIIFTTVGPSLQV